MHSVAMLKRGETRKKRVKKVFVKGPLDGYMGIVGVIGEPESRFTTKLTWDPGPPPKKDHIFITNVIRKS